MSLAENKAIVRKTIEAINAHDISSIESIVAPDFVDHTRQMNGPEGLKQFLSMIFECFSDFHMTEEDIIAEGDKVWILTTITATHTGEYAGLPPTNQRFTERSVWIYRIIEGKVVDGWDVQDELDFYKKIGAIEYTDKGKNLFPDTAN